MTIYVPRPVASKLALIAYVCLATIARAEPTATFIYEVDQSALHLAGRAEPKVDIKSLVDSVNRRLGGVGRATLLEKGQIQIDFEGPLDESEMEAVKMRATTMGFFEFRILASLSFEADRQVIKQAQSLTSEIKAVVIGKEVAAKWVRSSAPAEGQAQDETVTRKVGSNIETLVLMDSHNVTGNYLRAADKVRDQYGKPAVELLLGKEGANRLRKLTGDNLPNESGEKRRLGILMDDKLLAAPMIEETLSQRALLSGISSHEVDGVIAIMYEGVLPYPMREVLPKAMADASQ